MVYRLLLLLYLTKIATVICNPTSHEPSTSGVKEKLEPGRNVQNTIDHPSKKLLSSRMNEHLSLVFPLQPNIENNIPKIPQHPNTKVPSSNDNHSLTPNMKSYVTSQNNPTNHNQEKSSTKVPKPYATSFQNPTYLYQNSDKKTQHKPSATKSPTQSFSTTSNSNDFLLTSSEPLTHSSKIPNHHLTQQNKYPAVQSIPIHKSNLNTSSYNKSNSFNHTKNNQITLKSSNQYFSTLKPAKDFIEVKNSTVNIPYDKLNESKQSPTIHLTTATDISHKQTKMDLEVDQLISDVLNIKEDITSHAEMKSKPTSENSKKKSADDNPLKPSPYLVPKQDLTDPMGKQMHKSYMINEPANNKISSKHPNNTLYQSISDNVHNDSFAEKHMSYKQTLNTSRSLPMTIKTIDPSRETVQSHSIAKDDKKPSKFEDILEANADNIPALDSLNMNDSIPTQEGLTKYDSLFSDTLSYLKSKDIKLPNKGSHCEQNELYLLDKDKMVLLSSGSLVHEITDLRNFEDNLLLQIKNQESIISTLKSRLEIQEEKNKNIIEVTKSLKSSEDSMKKEISFTQNLLSTSRQATEDEMNRNHELEKKMNSIERKTYELEAQLSKKEQSIRELQTELNHRSAAYKTNQFKGDLEQCRSLLETEKNNKEDLEQTIYNLISDKITSPQNKNKTNLEKVTENLAVKECADVSLIQTQLAEQDTKIGLLRNQNLDLTRNSKYFNEIVISKDNMLLALQDQVRELLAHDVTSIQTCIRKDELIKAQYESIGSLKSLSFCQDKYAQARDTALNILRETIYKMMEKIPACGNVAMNGLKGEVNAMKDVIEPLKKMVEKLHSNVDNQLKLSDTKNDNQDVIESMKKIMNNQMGALDKCQKENKLILEQKTQIKTAEFNPKK